MKTTFTNGKQLLEALLATPHHKIDDLNISGEDMRTITKDLMKDGYDVEAFENTGCAFEKCQVDDYDSQTYISLNAETNRVTIAYI